MFWKIVYAISDWMEADREEDVIDESWMSYDGF